jgi:hypothetical protein
MELFIFVFEFIGNTVGMLLSKDVPSWRGFSA